MHRFALCRCMYALLRLSGVNCQKFLENSGLDGINNNLFVGLDMQKMESCYIVRLDMPKFQDLSHTLVKIKM